MYVSKFQCVLSKRYKNPHIGDTESLNLYGQQHQYKNKQKNKVSHVTCHLLPVTCHLSHVTCHPSPTLAATTTATYPPPTDFLTMHSRLVHRLYSIYISYIRSVFEQSAVVWHTSLTDQNISDLERDTLLCFVCLEC